MGGPIINGIPPSILGIAKHGRVLAGYDDGEAANSRVKKPVPGNACCSDRVVEPKEKS